MSAKRTILLFHFLFFVIIIIAFWQANLFYWGLLAFNLLFVFFNFRLIKSLKGNKKFFYFVLPWIFLNGLFFYSSLLVSKFLVALFLFLGVASSFYYFKGLRKHLSRDTSVATNNFAIWADTLGLLSVFLISSFVYGLNYFLNVSDWVLLTLISLILFLSAWQNIFIILNNHKKSWDLSLFFLLAISPIAGSLFLLPFSFNVSGMIVTVIYYFALSFLKFSLTGNLTNKKIKYNLIFIIGLLVVIFLTIKWR